MKPMITISLTREEATRLVKILYCSDCDNILPQFEGQLMDDLADLLDLKPWDL